MTGEEHAVLSAFERFQQAMIDKDLDALYAAVTPDKTFTHMSGKTQTKEQFFGEIEDGTLNYFHYQIAHPKVRIEGDYACLNATVTLTAHVYGFSGAWPLRTEAWFQNINNNWIYCNKPNF